MVYVDQERCVGCGACIPFCTIDVISLRGEKARIDLEKCVECQACIRSGVCPTDALYPRDLVPPRTIRQISNPTIRKVTGIPGRGTEEVKTNDVTGRIQRGEIGLCIDIGRPNVSTTIEDVERVAMALAPVGVEFEEQNPCTALMSDPTTGEFEAGVRKERVLSIIVEGKCPIANVPQVIEALRRVEQNVNTVFSVGMICRVDEDGSIPVVPLLRNLNVAIRPNGKTNAGLGRPLSSR